MNSSEGAGHEGDRGSGEGTCRDELAALLAPTTFPRTSQDATVNLRRAAAARQLLWRLNAAPPEPRSSSLDSLIASVDAHSNRQPPHPVDASPITAEEQDDILLQQSIDDLATSSRERQHQYVVVELAERNAEHNLPAKPQPGLNAAAAETITGKLRGDGLDRAGLRRVTTEHRPLGRAVK